MRRSELRRRMVHVTGLSAAGGHSKLWAFGYGDFAHLLGISEDAVRQMVSRGQFAPGDLEAICEFWQQRISRVPKPSGRGGSSLPTP
jgi:hypothetical protein